MKKMRLLYFTFILLSTGLTYGQSIIGVKVNGGLSYLKSELKTYPPTPMTQEYYPMFSGQGGLTYQYCFKNRFVIGTELLYSQIEGKDIENGLSGVLFNNNFIRDGHYQTTIYRHIYYLGLPFYVGYNLKKMTLNLGVQTNLKFGGGFHWYTNAAYDNGKIETFDFKSNSLNINKMDFGLRIGIFYKLSDKFSIETNYYYGLTNLVPVDSNDEPPVWNIQQLTFGLRYELFTLKEKNRVTKQE